jgi:hypothetical protein
MPKPFPRVPPTAARFLPTVALALAVAAPVARATPIDDYLRRYVLMMDWVERAIAYVPRHPGDTELAAVAQAVTERMVERAQRLTPPAELQDLHPHFLLVLENAERTFHFLALEERARADRHLAVVKEEIGLIRNIQRDLRIEIPVLRP